MNRRILFALILSAAVALAGCASEVKLLDETKLQDSSLLSGEPCEAPCWNGITPGETSYRDAKLILEGGARFKIADEPEPEGDNPGRVFSFAEGENPPCCQVISRDGETISSFLLQLAPAMTFGPVFDKYGEPKYVAGQAVSEEQAYAVFVYPDLPMVVYAFVAGGETGAVSVDNKIIGVMYMAASEMRELDRCLGAFYWQGFEALSIYLGDEYDYKGESFDDEEICPTSG